MEVFLLILVIVLLVFPFTRALIWALVVGTVALVTLPFVFIAGKISTWQQENTGEGKFMQPGQMPWLVYTIVLALLALVGIGVGIANM